MYDASWSMHTLDDGWAAKRDAPSMFMVSGFRMHQVRAAATTCAEKFGHLQAAVCVPIDAEESTAPYQDTANTTTWTHTRADQVIVGLGRIVALHDRPSTSYQIH